MRRLLAPLGGGTPDLAAPGLTATDPVASSSEAPASTAEEGSPLSPLPPVPVEQPVSTLTGGSLPLLSQLQAINKAKADVGARSGLAPQALEVVQSSYLDGVYTVRLVSPSRLYGQYHFRRIGGKLLAVDLTIDDRRHPDAWRVTQSYFSYRPDGRLSGGTTSTLVRDANLRPISRTTSGERLGPGGVVLSSRESGFRNVAGGVRDNYSIQITYEQGAIRQRITTHDYLDASGVNVNRNELTEEFRQGVVRLWRQVAESYGQVPTANITVNHVYDDRQIGTETTHITYYPGTRQPNQISKSSWTRDVWGSWYYWYEVVVYDVNGNVIHRHPFR
jgi:hypothetical protein